jgi:geranylgeranyl pyrophosphate synthase
MDTIGMSIRRTLTTNSAAAEAFATELGTVQKLLQEISDSLGMPLSKLVEEQIEAAAPPIRAAVVLAIAVEEKESERLRDQRIYLAAALEMLYVALNVHKLLLNDRFASADKSLLGGTILAGDYCFSQSATLAVKTENPTVVDLFSQALKITSEGNLRHLFDDDSPPFSDNLALCSAGVEAGYALLGHVNTSTDLLTQISMLVEQDAASATSLPSLSNQFSDELNSMQQNRLALLADWRSDSMSPLSVT